VCGDSNVILYITDYSVWRQ